MLGEVARASTLTPHVGPARAAAAAILTHGTYLWSIAIASTACFVAVSRCGPSSATLEGLVLWSAGFTAVLGTVFVLGSRALPIGSWLGRRIGLLEAHGPEAREEALRAAQEPGLAAAERSFWEAVAARVARHLGQNDAIPAHVGRLLAYALPAGAESQAQRALIERALRYRALPAAMRGSAPILRQLGKAHNPTGQGWASPGDLYGQRIAEVAGRILAR